ERRQRELDGAVNGLRGTRPDLSAGAPMARWQRWALLALLPAFAALAAFVPDRIVLIVAALLALPFSCVVALRSAALWRALKAPRQPGNVPHAEPVAIPRYSILVPLYDEANVVPDLLAALAAIDYPAPRNLSRARRMRQRHAQGRRSSPASAPYRAGRRSGRATAHQAPGPQLRVAPSHRRPRRHLRCRRYSRAGPTPPRRSGPCREARPRLRPG